MQRTLGFSKRFLQRCERGKVSVITIHKLKVVRQLFESWLVNAAAVGGYSFTRARKQLLARHVTFGDTNNWSVKYIATNQRLNGVEQFLMGKISGGSKKNHSVAV